MFGDNADSPAMWVMFAPTTLMGADTFPTLEEPKISPPCCQQIANVSSFIPRTVLSNNSSRTIAMLPMVNMFSFTFTFFFAPAFGFADALGSRL